MKKLNPQEELEQRIAFLKVKRDQDLMLLKYQYSETIDSLKPTNIIKTAIVDYVTAPNLKTQLLFGAIGLAKNYVYEQQGASKIIMDYIYKNRLLII